MLYKNGNTKNKFENILVENMKKEIKYFTKWLVIEYNNAAIRKKRNKAIKEDFLNDLNDEYIFPIIFLFYHSKNEIRVTISFFELGLSSFVGIVPDNNNCFLIIVIFVIIMAVSIYFSRHRLLPPSLCC